MATNKHSNESSIENDAMGWGAIIGMVLFGCAGLYQGFMGAGVGGAILGGIVGVVAGLLVGVFYARVLIHGVPIFLLLFVVWWLIRLAVWVFSKLWGLGKP